MKTYEDKDDSNLRVAWTLIGAAFMAIVGIIRDETPSSKKSTGQKMAVWPEGPRDGAGLAPYG